MKINTAVKRGYNIDYEAVIQDIKKIKAHCERMEYKADTLNKSVPSCHDEIISVNYEKTREITKANRTNRIEYKHPSNRHKYHSNGI